MSQIVGKILEAGNVKITIKKIWDMVIAGPSQMYRYDEIFNAAL